MTASATASRRRGAPQVPIRIGGILSKTSAEGNSSYGKGRRNYHRPAGPSCRPDPRPGQGVRRGGGSGVREDWGPEAYVAARWELRKEIARRSGRMQRVPRAGKQGTCRPTACPPGGCANGHFGSDFMSPALQLLSSAGRVRTEVTRPSGSPPADRRHDARIGRSSAKEEGHGCEGFWRSSWPGW